MQTLQPFSSNLIKLKTFKTDELKFKKAEYPIETSEDYIKSCESHINVSKMQFKRWSLCAEWLTDCMLYWISRRKYLLRFNI